MAAVCDGSPNEASVGLQRAAVKPGHEQFYGRQLLRLLGRCRPRTGRGLTSRDGGIPKAAPGHDAIQWQGARGEGRGGEPAGESPWDVLAL